MKTFELHRDEDETGISGKGLVAEGVEFHDRSCALRWLTEHKSTAVYVDIETLKAIHGHNGKTRVIYTGDPFRRGMIDCYQDHCENSPFASAGGLGARPNLRAPKWIAPREGEAWLAGYELAAKEAYGEDWATCSFGWRPAITISSASSPPENA